MNDKRKVLALGALGIVMLAVGAFQFMGISGGSAPVEEPTTDDKPNADKKAVATEDDPLEQALVAMLSGPLPPRDPFTPTAGIAFAEETLPPSNASGPHTTHQAAPSGASSYSPPPMPPFDPTGALPLSGGNAGIEDAPPLRNPNAFSFVLRGIVIGEKPLAVFEDFDGNQILVPLGGSIDGSSSRVKSIERNHVVVSHKGKTITLGLEGGIQ